MEKKLAEYKSETNEAISLKLGMYIVLKLIIFNTLEFASSFLLYIAALCNL